MLFSDLEVVIASEAKQSTLNLYEKELDCFVASAPRNDGRWIGAYRPSAIIIADPFSAIIAVGVLVLPDVIVGITDASTTRNPAMP